MKKAWRLKAGYGMNYLVLYSEDGKELDYYKESNGQGEIKPRAFTFREWLDAVPQLIANRLNAELKDKDLYAQFIENKL